MRHVSSKHPERPEKKRQILFLTVLTTILICLSFLSVFVFGTHCTLEFNVISPDSASIDYDKGVVECTAQHFSEGVLTMEFKGVSRGATSVMVSEKDEDTIQETCLYVHSFGIITVHSFLGSCRGDLLFSVSISVVFMTVLLMLNRRYRRSVRENPCRYINIRLLGAMIFIAVTLCEQLFSLVIMNSVNSHPSLQNNFQNILGSAHFFSMILLPMAVIISLAISISNLILMKREGIGLKNMLGLFLGVTLCLGTVGPDYLYPLMDRMGFNVHHYASPAVFFENCIEDYVSAVMAYFECILLGTAIMGVKAARHIPQFNKDYILILGCKIRKDGGLTKLLQSRADRAVSFAKMQKEHTGKEITFVPSGGKGDDEIIAEAEAIRNYLIAEGIPEERILAENQSKTTMQNIRFSYELIQQRNPDAQIAFSTTNYHVFRAGCFAEEAGIPMEGIGAKTKTYFWVNAFIREFVAELHYERIKHIRNLGVVFCCLIPVEVLIYCSNLF